MPSQINLTSVNSVAPPSSRLFTSTTHPIAIIESCLRQKKALQRKYHTLYGQGKRCYDQYKAILRARKILRKDLENLRRKSEHLAQQARERPSGGPKLELLNARLDLVRALLSAFQGKQQRLDEMWSKTTETINAFNYERCQIRDRLDEIEDKLNQFDAMVVQQSEALLEDGLLHQVLGKRVPLREITTSEMNQANW